MRNRIDLSPNYSKKTQNLRILSLLLYIHQCNQKLNQKKVKDPRKKVSSHYLINRKGEITKMVEERKTAWHAGKSRWKNFVNLNSYSIGIELVNKGHKFGYQKFSSTQITSLINLFKNLKKKYKIKN